MKRIIMLFLLLLPTLVVASPFIVSDNSTEIVTSCIFDGVPISCKLEGKHISVDGDNATLVSGTYTLKAKFCQGVWCSDWSLPFTFTKPKVIVPVGIRVQLQK